MKKEKAVIKHDGAEWRVCWEWSDDGVHHKVTASLGCMSAELQEQLDNILKEAIGMIEEQELRNPIAPQSR